MRRLAVVLSLLLMSLVLAVPASAGPSTTGFHWNDITAGDGVQLKSNVIEPATPGTHPGVVLVASWALNDFQYLAQAKQLAEAGYVVLSYTARGFWLSGGTIDVAGPRDVADASSAVDWLIAHTSVDPHRIGIVGMSYGGGISLLAAAHDPRLRAVGSLSGWSDMGASMTGGDTRRPQAAWFLQTAARLVGRPSPQMNQILDDYWADRDAEGRDRWARERSARYSVDALNRSNPAVLIAHSFGDSIFPANQMLDFYTALRTPKRLELAPGDHATVEISGLAGIPNHVWTSVRRWLDQYLAGIDTGIGDEPGVVLRPHNSSAAEYYPDWSHVTGHDDRLRLGAPHGLIATGDLGPQPQGTWTRRIQAGTDTIAGGGVALLTNGLEQLTGIPPIVSLPAVSRRHAGVWLSGAAPAGGWRVRGVPRLHAPLASTHPAGTVIAYLYDVNALGIGKLFSHAPVTWHGSPATVDLPLQVTAYDLPSGHRLALVVDTKDPLYLDANAKDATITFSSDAWLDVPIA
ncbi:CocE/NonD family hydrolase [Actinoplanes oblitus]|uniref:CocE/NonD family hydrolase n=1 Tax=Actinoplanes oblitus TaxID=3040509 RepID=A0ABY8WR33_9ACTN|nr:CocE/NonD family hydrolase [Actinoplanes oblitus]WIM99902.1 CocE/NonD family hydrolase [Actinoplanes oblitus]